MGAGPLIRGRRLATALLGLVLSGCGGVSATEDAQTPASAAPEARCTTGASGTPAVGSGATGTVPREPFLVDTASQAALQAAADPAHAAEIALLVRTPTAFPVGDWLTDVTGQVRRRAAAAVATGSTAVFMVYAIPHRDIGAGFSSGGFRTAEAYRAFTRQVAAGIGTARAVVVLEPDSLAQLDQLTAAQQAERYGLLNDAVDVYGRLPGTSVYLDGANCGWTQASVIAERLKNAGVGRARGFAVNVANYYRTTDEVTRGDVISALTGGAHFVVDTSRNGRGAVSGIVNAWCNPPGRGLGPAPTTDTGDPRADAFLWIKTPGASDGTCGRGDPAAGQWWQAQAEELVRNAEGH
ncbi:glycoside hydrolase family 6 protein [Pseudofrankia sp. DC12]|uniref:glycoside hydrolase family 6 protein n=1 Tax=Pseudofrankia sp. DC12 TaxID=683315 RepID=UPI000B12B0B4|nr:glycoside hydrolase family 6 protein [Pseudofrankia sp. DC12]